MTILSLINYNSSINVLIDVVKVGDTRTDTVLLRSISFLNSQLMRRITHFTTLSPRLTELKKESKLKSKKVKAVYKHIYTTFQFLFKLQNFPELLGSISCGRSRVLGTLPPV
jgi:hypothetical protein